MGNPFSNSTMRGDFSDDEIQIVEFVNPTLLTENNKPMKIYLEGFMPVELLKLRDIIKKYGGEISRNPEIGIIILSPSDYFPKTERDRFQVKWLHESISSNVIQDIQEYELIPQLLIKIKADPGAQDEIVMPVVAKKEQEHQIQQIAAPPITVGILKESPTKLERKSKIRPIYKESDNDSSSEDEEPLSKRRERKSRKRFAAKHSCTCSDSSENKRRVYNSREEQAMIDFLIEKKAIDIARGIKVWEKMVKEKRIKRKAQGLRGHFNTSLKYRVGSYTDDERVLAEFKKRDDDLQRRRSFLD